MKSAGLDSLLQVSVLFNVSYVHELEMHSVIVGDARLVTDEWCS